MDVDRTAVKRLADMCAVYRMYDTQERPIYIGMTGDLQKRISTHSDRRWFPLVTTITLEWFPTRAAARVAEQEAIRAERPYYNIASKPVRSPQRRQPRPAVAVTLLNAGQLVSLAEAVAAGIVPYSLGAMRQCRWRDPEAFPEVKGHRPRGEKLYEAASLAAYCAARVDRRRARRGGAA
jgi:hypothetical protein